MAKGSRRRCSYDVVAISADGDPVVLATSYPPGGIYARLEEVTARMPSPERIRSLRLKAGTPVSGLRRTTCDDVGVAVGGVRPGDGVAPACSVVRAASAVTRILGQ